MFKSFFLEWRKKIQTYLPAHQLRALHLPVVHPAAIHHQPPWNTGSGNHRLQPFRRLFLLHLSWTHRQMMSSIRHRPRFQLLPFSYAKLSVFGAKRYLISNCLPSPEDRSGVSWHIRSRHNGIPGRR